MVKTYGPYMEMARIQSEINRLFENLLQLREGTRPEQGLVATADVYDNADAVVVEVELPGVEASDLTLLAHGPDVIIRGNKVRPPVPEGAQTQSEECAFGPFEQVITLNLPVNTHLAEAQFREGLLRIVFPKVDNRRGEAVAITIRED